MAAMASDYMDYYKLGLLFRCYNDTKTAEVFVSDFHWTRGQIVIPEQVELNGDSYTVTAIADRAFESTTISKVTLPPTIERIGDCAFAGTLIESVELPDSLKELGKEAFYDCFLLQSVTFPNAGKDIKMGERVFAYTSLESVELPEGITSIPEEAFDSDTQLKSVILPSTLKSIGDGAFYECGMTAITLPEGLESLGNWVFCMSALESVELPESLKEIGDYALSYTKLTSLNLPSSFTVIPNGIYAASNIKEIDIPEHIREIGYAAFECCNSLRKVTMHNGMTVIGNGAFNSCMALEEIEIPETVEEMGYGVFYGTNNLRKLTFNGKVTKFAGNLCIPDSCEVIIDEENKVLEMIDNVLVQNTPDGRRVAIMIPQSKVVDGELTIGGDDGIAEIAPFAAVLLDVKNVAIGEGVTRIGSNAFEESTLETISLPSTLKELGDRYTFGWCPNLRSIDIPEGVTSIPNNCFFHCPSLTHVGLPSSIKHLKSNSFAYTPQLEEISLPEGLENIDDKAFYNSGLKKVAVPSSCKEYCFNYLDSLQQVELAEGAIDIPADAFKFCFALESARLPNSLKTIGDNAFHVCPKLSDVTIPEGVESIGQYAFRRTGIENLVIPESATK
ncbi:MAG: leucine-rich repeat domain-containing protein, partial [Prevotella sp.]